MKLLLIFLVSLFALSTTATTTVVYTELSAEEVKEIGLLISSKDLSEYFASSNSGSSYPLFITLEPDPDSKCEINSAFLSVYDNTQTLLFAVGIERRSGQYHFNLQANYLDSPTIRFACSSRSPDRLRGNFQFNVGENIQSP